MSHRPCVQDAEAGRLRAAVGKLRAVALAAFMKAYPFMHMAGEGLTFSYQLAYLLQSSPYFSPGLHLLRQHVVRTSARELVCPPSHMLLACCLSGVCVFISLATHEAPDVLNDSNSSPDIAVWSHWPLNPSILEAACAAASQRALCPCSCGSPHDDVLYEATRLALLHDGMAAVRAPAAAAQEQVLSVAGRIACGAAAGPVRAQQAAAEAGAATGRAQPGQSPASPAAGGPAARQLHLHRPHSQRPHSGGVRLQGKPVSEMLFFVAHGLSCAWCAEGWKPAVPRIVMCRSFWLLGYVPDIMWNVSACNVATRSVSLPDVRVQC